MTTFPYIVNGRIQLLDLRQSVVSQLVFGSYTVTVATTDMISLDISPQLTLVSQLLYYFSFLFYGYPEPKF